MRIASLVPSSTEALFALGIGDRLVARTHECDFPPEAAAVPVVTSSIIDSELPSALIDEAVIAGVRDDHTIYSLDSDALMTAAPDLVLTQSLCKVCAVEATAIADCGLPAGARVVSSNPKTLDDVLESLVAIADAADVAAAGRSLVARLRSRLLWVSSLVADLDRPRVAVIEWPDPIYAPGHWVPEMVETAGGINVFGSRGAPSVPTTADELAASRPDVVVLAFCGYDLYKTQARFSELTADPRFIEATRFARTFAVDSSSYFSRPGPRLVDGVELLAWALHRSHPRLQPPVGRGAKLIEAGWVDVAALPVMSQTSV